MGDTLAAASLPPEFSGVTTPTSSTLELDGVSLVPPTRVEGTDGVAMSFRLSAMLLLSLHISSSTSVMVTLLIPCGAYHDAPNIATETEDDDAVGQPLAQVVLLILLHHDRRSCKALAAGAFTCWAKLSSSC